MTSDKKRLAILSDMLYVPSSEVRNEHLNAYTYKFEKVTYEKPTDVTRKCANCELWKKPWRNAEGIEMYCHKLGYTETDYCNRFNPKQVRKVEEYEVTTYKEVANEYYAFGRGDLGKVERVFGDFEVVDQRSAPKLGIPLKLKEGRVLRPDQVAVAEEWLKHGYGIIKAPTAFGKCSSKSSLIATSEGLIPIGKFVDKILGKKYTTISGLDTKEVSHLNLYVTSNGHKAKISDVCRKKAVTTKIQTKWGYSIECTPEHPLQTITDKGLNWREVKDLKPNDYIAIRGFDFYGSPKNLEEYSYINTCTTSPNKKPIRLPTTITPSFSRLLGALTADGTLSIKGSIAYTKTEEALIEDFRNSLKQFDLELDTVKNRTVEHKVRGGITAFQELLQIIGVKQETARYKEVPWIVLQSGKEIAKQFLKGYFSGDGEVAHELSHIECSSASKQLIETIQIMLLGFCIPSIIYPKPVKLEQWDCARDYWRLYIGPAFLKKFQEEIGFIDKTKKSTLLEAAVVKYDNRNNSGSEFTLPISGLLKKAYQALILNKAKAYETCKQFKHIWERGSRVDPRTLKRFLELYQDYQHLPEIAVLQEIYDLNQNHGLWFVEVKEITEGAEQYVYDITVPEGHWYVANGIVSHNTVLWCYLVQHLGMRSLLLAQEVRHLAVGWEGLYEHTNLAELEEEAGEFLWGKVGHDTSKVVTQVRNSKGELVDRVEFKFKKSKDPAKIYPITFSTYQSLHSEKGWEILQTKLRDSFGFIHCEEAHHSAAETFHHVTKSFNSYYRGGQSATPTRKDQMHCATYDTIGPVTALATKEQMNCDFTFINTGVYLPDKVFNGMYPLTNVFNFLATNTDVQNCLLQWMNYDIQSGRKPLYITERKADAFSLKSKIHLSGYNVELIMGGQKMQKQQKEYSEELLNGSLHCIIGTKVIKENYNIPPLDTLYLLYPNFVVESEEQMTGRIRRYVLDAEGNQVFKNKPLIRIFTVNSSQEVMKKSINFRKNFYYKMSFEEIQVDTTEHETEKPDDRVSSKLKDW